MKEDVLDQALLEIKHYYSSQGMAAKIGFGKRPAVLVVDFQKGITDPKRPAGCSLDKEIESSLLLLKKARCKNIPIFFFVLGCYHQSLVDGGLLIEKVPALKDFKLGNDHTEIDPRLALQPGEEVVVKKYASCFFGTTLASSLTVLGVDTVIIVGCITSGCIRATSNDALQHGFRPIIARECVGDRARIPHEVNLMDIQARCGDVLALEQVMEYLDKF